MLQQFVSSRVSYMEINPPIGLFIKKYTGNAELYYLVIAMLASGVKCGSNND